MTHATGFYFHERCMWHSGQMHAGIFPIGGWIQPPNAAGFATLVGLVSAPLI